MDTPTDAPTLLYHYLVAQDAGPVVVRFEDGKLTLMLFSSAEKAEAVLERLAVAVTIRETTAASAPNLAAKFFGHLVRSYILDLEPEQFDDEGRLREDAVIYLWPLTANSLEGVVT